MILQSHNFNITANLANLSVCHPLHHLKMKNCTEKNEDRQSPVSDEQPRGRTKPKNVSSTLWERFQNISKKTDEVTKRSTEKRIQQIQISALSTVEDQLKSEEEKEILKKHNGELYSSNTGKPEDERSSGTQQTTSKEDQFKELNKCMGVNDHLVRADSSRQYVKTGLEKQIDQAVASGDITTAEQLSDQLATRNFGVRVSEAIQAKEYLKRKKEEEETIKAKKKKKLAWGFQHKERWETKSNM